ncbi:MAG: aminotransferase class I/II-fold pyridoxal phosphate-dependent enzyme [Candidatus Dormibacteria bacterium]
MDVVEQYYPTARTGVEIVAGVEGAVREGRLTAGDRLPTIRDLATHLGLSPTTVAGAYRDLGARGVINGAGRQGTRVAARPLVASRSGPRFAPGIRDLARGNPDPLLLPPLAPAVARAAAAIGTPLYGDGTSDGALLTLARERLEADGIPADHLTVVGGALDGIERVLGAHLRPGDRVAVEDPGYSGLLELLAALGLVTRPVPVDDSGMSATALAATLAGGAEAVLVTPRAQNPFGSALDAERAEALRRVVTAHPHVLVVEDDHAVGVAGSPAHSLAADRERWSVIRSVSKALAPDLRVAVVTGDSTTVARVEGRRLLGTGWVSHLLQRTVVELWSDTEVGRTLEHARATYAQRRTALLNALAARRIAAHGRSGLNVWVPVDDEAAVAGALLAEGWGVLTGERFRLGSPRAVRVTVAELVPHDAERLAAAFERAVRTVPSRLG